MSENKSKTEIIITVQGGLIQDIAIPKGSGIVVKVMDYDVEDYDEDNPNMQTDKNGDEYHLAEWEGE